MKKAFHQPNPRLTSKSGFELASRDPKPHENVSFAKRADRPPAPTNEQFKEAARKPPEKLPYSFTKPAEQRYADVSFAEAARIQHSRPRGYDRYVRQDQGKAIDAFTLHIDGRGVERRFVRPSRGSAQVRGSTPGLHLRPNGVIRAQVDGVSHARNMTNDHFQWQSEVNRVKQAAERKVIERKKDDPERDR